MINGHGDDVFNYPDIRINFSSNVYNHFNPFMIVFNSDSTKPTGIKATEYALFGIVPSVSYSVSF